MPDTQNTKEVPLVLVRTWYELLKEKDDESVRQHATKMLLGAFGTHEALERYLRKHNIL